MFNKELMRLVDFLANFVYNVYARNYKFLESNFNFFGHIYLVPLTISSFVPDLIS